ncbi:ferrochelatase [Sorangium cellulosum]|uniref:Ferrochelatase n=1 Tax=Sorangium cellulosum TaxID=56 RepID=A0A2L0EHE9_SORCE|nr:ferrochelatase [Sorangium cellulosum]AUX38724.1 ferrochelatase [Sorangium cellulosum]
MTQPPATPALPAEERDALARLTPLLGARASVAPDRPCAPTPLALVEQVMDGSDGSEDEARARALARGLGEVIRAVADNFPDNIFWDLDYLTLCLWQAGSAPATLDFARRVVSLCLGFGNKSKLRFRYAHDFLYGYDWARWVMRKPEERAGVGPFDLAFFDYLDGRQQALCELVASNDRKYSPLNGREFRNPFSFIREPSEERQLHCLLAQVDLIPLKAWRLDGERRWDLPFTDLRARLAERLGLARAGDGR